MFKHREAVPGGNLLSNFSVRNREKGHHLARDVLAGGGDATEAAPIGSRVIAFDGYQIALGNHLANREPDIREGREIRLDKLPGLLHAADCAVGGLRGELSPTFGFRAGLKSEAGAVHVKLRSIALAAVRKRFSPEFVNRIDVVITYQPLDDEFLRHGTSAQYGARELKRTLHGHLMQPLATMVAAGEIAPGSLVRAEVHGDSVARRTIGTATKVETSHPVILIVDDNLDLLRFLETWMIEAGCKVHAAHTPGTAKTVAVREKPLALFTDSILGEASGVELAVDLHHKLPEAIIVIMADNDLPREERELAAKFNFSLLRKPF